METRIVIDTTNPAHEIRRRLFGHNIEHTRTWRTSRYSPLGQRDPLPGTLESAQTFGVRTVELVRTANEMTLHLNGRPCFVRGATYWPDLYISNVDRARYKRDLDSLIRAGMNAVRIHVHTENDDFYDLCDQMGVLVFQDPDLTWAFPTDDAFAAKATVIFGDMIRHLRSHPSIACWICMNEATGDYQTDGKQATMLSCDARW